MKAIWFGRHLYEPLLYLDTNIVEISPAPLNKGERQFVEDLKAFHDSATQLLRRQGALPAAQSEQGPRRRLLRGRQFPSRLHPVAARRTASSM